MGILTYLQEPRRQFLANSKMCPVLLGIGREGVVRVDFRTKQVRCLHVSKHVMTFLSCSMFNRL